MNNSKALSRWARTFAPVLLVILVVGCSTSGPVGPVGNEYIDDPEPIIRSDQIVDTDRLPDPQKLDEEGSAKDDPQAIIDIDRSVDRNQLPEPQKLEDQRGRINDVNDVGVPDRAANMQGRFVEADDVSSAQK
jgi:hypothetical protein